MKTKTKTKTRYILNELRSHAPFTMAGAVLGVIFMLVFGKLLGGQTSQKFFDVFHPAHVVLSAVATAAMFKIHSRKTNFLIVLLVGYVGAVGIATLSDCLIPHASMAILGIHVDAHGYGCGASEHQENDQHEASYEKLPEQDGARDDHHHVAGEDNCGEDQGHDLHLGFIDQWYIVNPAAVLGVLLAFFYPHTKIPHAGHVLLSIWASLFYILRCVGTEISTMQWLGISVFLFLAVWLPCCISDIVFPLLFVKPDQELPTHCH